MHLLMYAESVPARLYSDALSSSTDRQPTLNDSRSSPEPEPRPYPLAIVAGALADSKASFAFNSFNFIRNFTGPPRASAHFRYTLLYSDPGLSFASTSSYGDKS